MVKFVRQASRKSNAETEKSHGPVSKGTEPPLKSYPSSPPNQQSSTSSNASSFTYAHPNPSRQHSRYQVHPSDDQEDIIAEIVVRTDDNMDDDSMDIDQVEVDEIDNDPMDIDAPEYGSLSPLSSVPDNFSIASSSALQSMPYALADIPEEPSARPLSFASSSALSVHSELSLAPVSFSSEATTPALAEPANPISIPAPVVEQHRKTYDISPGTSIPLPRTLDSAEFSRQCVSAARASRLSPDSLHPGELSWLRNYITPAQVTNYLILRNRILWLFFQDPRHAVTRLEAVGCARDPAWLDVAASSFDWLFRNGFINFGCVKIPPPIILRAPSPDQPTKQKTIVIIGAGMAGLGCARHLTSLSTYYAESFKELGELPPKIIVLEGRGRVGGRIHSREFRHLADKTTPGFEGRRRTAEVGGMIITGFRRGNPLNTLVRAQLGLPYYKIRPATFLYDINGRPIDQKLDDIVELTFNFILDRLSAYRFDSKPIKTVSGLRDWIEKGQEISATAGGVIAACEQLISAPSSAITLDSPTNMPFPKLDIGMIASIKAELMGWKLHPHVVHPDDIEIDQIVRGRGATLGSVGDAIIQKLQTLVDLSPEALRVFNWHIANHEYANAINWSNLSLRGWDIDNGNEWRGSHSMVVGGYQSVPRGLMESPTRLNVRQESQVTKIIYDPDKTDGRARIECHDGFAIEADHIVNTIPLGVLKHKDITFQPKLPIWKTEVIDRLGFGTLNKIVLVYDRQFWNKDRDIFGILHDTANNTLQADYAAKRGHLFQWIDLSKTAGLPCLLAFMAGDAALRAEQISGEQILQEATQTLRTIYGDKVPAKPREFFVTKWGSDPFSRGSYSSAGPEMLPDDYDVMAQPVGNLFFAGEHTSSTHPATVHGAYLSGLRAASEVFERLVGAITLPASLRPAQTVSLPPVIATGSVQGAMPQATPQPTGQDRIIGLEEELRAHMVRKPEDPSNVPYRPFEVFWHDWRPVLEERVRRDPGKMAKGTKTVREWARAEASELWKGVGEADREPYKARAALGLAEKKRREDVFPTLLQTWETRRAELEAALRAASGGI